MSPQIPGQGYGDDKDQKFDLIVHKNRDVFSWVGFSLNDLIYFKLSIEDLDRV